LHCIWPANAVFVALQHELGSTEAPPSGSARLLLAGERA
jgi:hypothetical protein